MRLVADRTLRRLDGGRVLLGGSPLKLLRLRDAGARVVARLLDGGEPVPTSGSGAQLVDRLLDAGMVVPVNDGDTFDTDDVTVVVPVHDRRDGLHATLGAIGTVGDVVVVDDGSRTPIPEATTRHDAPRGPAGARNAGWRAASTPLIAFVDADVVPDARWLAPLLAHFDDPRVGAVAPRIVADARDLQPRWLAAYERVRSPLDLGPHPSPVRPKAMVPYVPTAALVVRRAALENIDGFDEAMRVGEDVDFVWRLHEAGWRVRYEPRSVVHHPARSTISEWLRQRFDYGTSAAPLASRHPGDVAPVAVSGWSAAAWALVAAGHPVAGVGTAAGTTVLLAPKLQPLPHAWREAIRLAGTGHVLAGRRLADAVTRAWWPAALAAAAVSKRARRALAVAAIVPALLEWRERRPTGIDPARFVLAKLADDVAYGAGVWSGCLTERSLAALRPDLANWPGRTTTNSARKSSDSDDNRAEFGVAT
jgi:mycofactocin system glycosyltransferase